MYEGVYKDIIIFYDVHGGVLLADIYICNLYSWRGPRDRSKGVLLEEML